MAKCICCYKNIDHLFETGKLISWGTDGDFLCSNDCKKTFKKRMYRINTMTDENFEKWILGKNTHQG